MREDEARAKALREYEDALTFFLTHCYKDVDSDLCMRRKLFDADREIEKHGLRSTLDHYEAVLRADRNASASRTAQRSK